MKYEKRLVTQLKNPWGHLWWDDTYPLSSLTAYANDSFNQKTSEGILAATIIFHQLSEELIRIILRYNNLLVRASIYPNKTSERYFTKEEKFSVLVKFLKTTIEFEGNKEMIKLCTKINQERNKLSHRLVEKYYAFQNDSHNSTILQDFNALFECWKKSINWYNEEFERILDRKELQPFLRKFS